jgi:hypothetical protein
MVDYYARSSVGAEDVSCATMRAAAIVRPQTAD